MKALTTGVAACVIAVAGGRVAGQQAADPAGAEQPASQAPLKTVETAVTDIERALHRAADVPAEAISVTVHADTVVLSGEVESQLQAARVVALAQQQAGGVRVSSHVEVRPTATSSEVSSNAAAKVREVESALRQDRRTASLGVAVSIDDEQVIGLHGLVPSRESRAAAEQVAAGVDGVTQVDSRLVVPGE